MEKQKHQKVAIVTGSSKGIGQAIAIRLAKDGYFVYVTYHTDEKGGQSTLKEIKKNGGEGVLEKLDVTNEESVMHLMNTVKKEFGYLDVLVNNAERDICKDIENSTFEEWKLAIDVKVHGAWLSTKYALPLLKKSEDPNIIMVTTSADERPPEDVLTYAVASGAVNCFTKAITKHLAKYRIRVNAVSPCQVRTANWGDLQFNDEFWRNVAQENPFGRVATVEEVADAVMIPLNDPHKFLNGNFIYVDGGSHLK
jgi:NAD(P)-dependent dehydrogenase (short-subunit alcohol dehydrogenase family)